MTRNSIGDTRVAILVPSRFGDGRPIDPAARQRVITTVQNGFSARFRGASVETIQGAYLHEDGSERITHEPIDRVYSAVPRSALSDEEVRNQVDALARLVARELDQECVLVEWGAESILVSPDERGRPAAQGSFRGLGGDLQEQFARAACARMSTAKDMAGVLSLDGWTIEPDPAGNPEGLLGASAERRAYLRREGAGRPHLHPGDLAFADAPDGTGVLVWAHAAGAVRGPRKLPKPDPHVARLAVDMALAILGSGTVEPLPSILDREVATAEFYRRYERLHTRMVEAMKRSGDRAGAEHGDAQLLLGRLMFLRFVEQRGWLAGNRGFLRALFENKGRRSFVAVLTDLCRLLDTPVDARDGRADEVIPFLNGGLFDVSRPIPSVPDALFDPDKEGSVLGLFARYDFTLDESTTAEAAAAVDPSMFGLVLESLRAQEERKGEGIFYTPRPIARALAFESIVSRLADLTRLRRSKLTAFLRGDDDAIADTDVDLLLRRVDDLRIVDPAVGSGSLLLAALDVLMDIVQRCHEWNESPLPRGSRAWSRKVRAFAQRCLYGVDVDGEAVEVARLRLWLAIAVGDDRPMPLPDLGHNLAVGDSLASRGFDDEMLKAGLWNRQGSLFEGGDAHVERYRAALGRYYGTSPADVSASREAAKQLRDAERALITKLDPKAQGAPFAWTVHFGDVFARENAGFDVVIANPPYVRAQRLDREKYAGMYPSLRGNTDLYVAFVERGLDLAGKKGELAYILPNFGDKQAGAELRRLLADRGAVDRMVSFGDQQVFATATNYVALFFATGEKRKRKGFGGGRVDGDAWRTATDTTWLEAATGGTVEYADDPWLLLAPEEMRWIRDRAKTSVPLGLLCSIEVGIQTSADDVFLFESKSEARGGIVKVRSEYLGKDVAIEARALRRCAKGSKDLKPGKVINDRHVLWPYGDDNEVLEQAILSKRFPKAWEYLRKCRSRLEDERATTVRGGKWWAFGRSQGVEVGTSSKLIVPSLMKEATAVYDRDGDIAITASGKGGGGAYAIRSLPAAVKNPAANPEWLLEVLNSPETTKWIQLVGDMKQGGYRGVDRSLLERLPISTPTSSKRGRGLD